MNAGTDAAEQIVRMSLNGVEIAARISGKAALRIASFLYAIMKDQKKTRGKTRLTSMLKKNNKLTVFTINDEYLSRFCYEAKRYGILYCILKDKTANDGVTDIMVKETDKEKVSRIFERYNLYDYDISDVLKEKAVSQEKNGNVEIVPSEPVEDEMENRETGRNETAQGSDRPTEEKEQSAPEKTSDTKRENEAPDAMKAEPDTPDVQQAEPESKKLDQDSYIEKVLAAEKEKKEEELPTQARADRSSQSGRSSGTRKSGSPSRGKAERGKGEDEDMRNRPSVRKELEKINKSRRKPKNSPVRENTKSPEHIAPKKKKNWKER